MCYSSPNMQVLTTAPFPSPQVASRLHAEALWRLGYTGKGVHVAVFDTGLGHGLPQLAVGATWNVALAHSYGAALGAEFRAKGANVILGPGVNLARVALNGRAAEYISGEEPALGAAMGSAYVRGVQSQGVAAVVKHFAVTNQETLRTETDVIVSERALWEVYYAAFEACIEAGVASVMVLATARLEPYAPPPFESPTICRTVSAARVAGRACESRVNGPDESLLVSRPCTVLVQQDQRRARMWLAEGAGSRSQANDALRRLGHVRLVGSALGERGAVRRPGNARHARGQQPSLLLHQGPARGRLSCVEGRGPHHGAHRGRRELRQ